MTDAEVTAQILRYGVTGSELRMRLMEIRTSSGGMLDNHLDALRWWLEANRQPQAAAVAEVLRGGGDVRGRVLALFSGVE